MGWLALSLPLLALSCQGLAGPGTPDPPPREPETMPAHHDAGRIEATSPTRCRIYFGCIAVARKAAD